MAFAIAALIAQAVAAENENGQRPNVTGAVRDEAGNPATNVTVYLADAGQNGVYVGKGGKLVVREEIYRGTRKTKTDGAGRFSFPTLPDPYAILVVDTNGFAEVRTSALKPTRKCDCNPMRAWRGSC